MSELKFKQYDKVTVDSYDGIVFTVRGYDALVGGYIVASDVDGDTVGYYGPGIYTCYESLMTPCAEPAPENATITLTRAEAYALASVCSRIGGDPADTPRGPMDTIRVKLEGEGFYFGDSPFLHRFDRYIQAKGV